MIVSKLCADCGRGIRQRAAGKQGRWRAYCAACAQRRQAASMRGHHVERAAALKYCRAHGVDAIAWLEGQKASGEGCPGCGEPCNNADGRRCAECAAR